MKYLMLLVVSLFSLNAYGDDVSFSIYAAATHFKINPVLMRAICQVESRCKPNAVNHDDGTARQKAAGVVSKSHGLFQIKMSTANWLGFKGTVRQLQQPEINAWYAAKYLSRLYSRYHHIDKVISAYNAGSYTTKNQPYVNKVLKQYAIYTLDRN